MPRPSKLVALLALSALVVAPAVLAGRQSARSVRTRQRRGTCKTTTTTTPASPDPAPSLPVVVDDDQRQTWCSTATPPLDPSLVQKIKDNLEERGNQSWVSGIR